MSFEKSYLFAELDQRIIEELESALTSVEYAEGDLIFERGEAARYLYILEFGRVRMTLGGSGLVTRSFRRPGDVLGWSSAVLNETYTATAQSLCRSCLRRISGKQLQEILEKDPVNGLRFYRRLARVIRQRLIDSYKSLLTYDSERKPYSYG